jgi:hypothetical protein
VADVLFDRCGVDRGLEPIDQLGDGLVMFSGVIVSNATPPAQSSKLWHW